MHSLIEELDLGVAGDRVRAHTAPMVNQRIDELMLTSVASQSSTRNGTSIVCSW
jgi:hypothetical protein